jgi:hypothetical protein
MPVLRGSRQRGGETGRLTLNPTTLNHVWAWRRTTFGKPNAVNRHRPPHFPVDPARRRGAAARRREVVAAGCRDGVAGRPRGDARTAVYRCEQEDVVCQSEEDQIPPWITPGIR